MASFSVSETMYCTEPPRPEAIEIESSTNIVVFAGFGIRRHIRMWFRKDRSGPFIDWTVWLPNRPREETTEVPASDLHPASGVPVVLFLNYGGDVQLAEGRRHVPLSSILARGYAVMTAHYEQIAPDDVERMDDGVLSLWPRTRPDAPRSLGAWAWGLSRGLDLAERLPEIDAKRAVVTGSSRLGKAALLAGARDERFAVVVPNQTGKGGVPLTRHPLGETIAREKDSFPHWFKDSYLAYAGRDREIPYDQHLLLACVAPRRLLVTGFDSSWFDTEAEYMACRAASPVWKLLGLPGLPDRPFPPDYDTSCVSSHVGYVRRTEQHGLSPYDWQWILGFAKRAFRAAEADRE